MSNDRQVYVLMGVSGSGKTSLGKALAHQLGWPFHEGDDYHPAANIEKMSGGTPLTNADRAPWITAIAAGLNAEPAPRQILACSALSAIVREWLDHQVAAPVTFIYLAVGREELARRLETRPGHFFKGSMLDSQLAALEAPAAGGNVMVVEGERPLEVLVEDLAERLA